MYDKYRAGCSDSRERLRVFLEKVTRAVISAACVTLDVVSVISGVLEATEDTFAVERRQAEQWLVQPWNFGRPG